MQKISNFQLKLTNYIARQIFHIYKKDPHITNFKNNYKVILDLYS